MSTTDKPEVRYPDAHVQLSGQDGNIFFIMGRVVGALRDAGVPDEKASEFTAEVMDSDSYEAALGVVMKWVSTS